LAVRKVILEGTVEYLGKGKFTFDKMARKAKSPP